MGGRADASRLAFLAGGVDFEDIRMPMKELKSKFGDKATYGSFPIMEVDGRFIAQSNTILRYAGVRGGLYPSDPVTAAAVDEVLDGNEELITRLALSIHPERVPGNENKTKEELGEIKVAMRKALSADTGYLPKRL